MSLALCALGALVVLGAAQAQPTPIEHFVRYNKVDTPVVSPNGRRIAMVSEADGLRIVLVLSRDGEAPRAVNADAVNPESLFWANDDVLVIRASMERDRNYDDDFFTETTMFAFDLQNGELRELFDLGADAPRSNGNAANVRGRDPETGRLAVQMADRLYSIDPNNGRYRSMDRTMQPVFSYTLGPDGQALTRANYSQFERRYWLEVRTDEYWETVIDREESVIRQAVYGLLTGTDDEIVASERPFSGTRRLFTISATTGEPLRTLYQHPDFDFRSVEVDPFTNLVVGVQILEDLRRTEWFDPDLAAIQASLEAAIPDASITLESWSQDRSEFTLAAWRMDQPVEYYFYDSNDGSLGRLGSALPELQASGLTSRVAITFPARDGTAIPAYLTLPAGEGPWPLVVLPHGGPASRDVGGYDMFAHFIADRGYLVVQPNFRGSSGLGGEWERAGWGGWGRGVMQHDVSDSVSALVRSGYARADSACILGASYGGYVALSAATFTPDLFQCAMAIAPVSDLWTIVDDGACCGLTSTRSRDFARMLTGSMEQPSRREARHISPMAHADQVRIPLLIAHGLEDSVVPVEQSEFMEDALSAAGIPFTMVWMESADHHFDTVEARREVLTLIEDFLSEHLPVD